MATLPGRELHQNVAQCPSRAESVRFGAVARMKGPATVEKRPGTTVAQAES